MVLESKKQKKKMSCQRLKCYCLCELAILHLLLKGYAQERHFHRQCCFSSFSSWLLAYPSLNSVSFLLVLVYQPSWLFCEQILLPFKRNTRKQQKSISLTMCLIPTFKDDALRDKNCVLAIAVKHAIS